MNYEPQNPEFWLQLKSDDVVKCLLSEMHMFSVSVHTTYSILLMSENPDDLVLPDGVKLKDFLEDQIKKIEAFRKIGLAASSWETAYKEGKLDLGDYPKPKSDNEDI